MKTIDVSSWNLFSERSYSRSYSSPDGLQMLKAVDANDKVGASYLNEEYNIGVIANKLGIPTVKVFDLVQTSNNEVAILYEYIKDKVSCSRGISREPERLEEYVKIFTSVVKKIHAIEVDPALLPSFQSKVFNGIDNAQMFSDREKDRLKERFLALPGGTKCLHGDMQLSNVIHSTSGDFAIDLGLLSYGNPLFDVAFFYYLTLYLPDELVLQVFHFDRSTFRKCWELYAKEYFGSDNIKEIEEYILPYAKISALPVLIIDGNMPSVNKAKDFILSE